MLAITAEVRSLSQESIKSAHRRLVVAHIFPRLEEGWSSTVNSTSAAAGVSRRMEDPASPDHHSIEDTLNPDDEKEREVRGILSENKATFSKIFWVYTRRSKQLSVQAWLEFCSDFDLTEALSKSVLGTIFRGVAGEMDLCLSMKGFLQALRTPSVCFILILCSVVFSARWRADMACLVIAFAGERRPHRALPGHNGVRGARLGLLRPHHIPAAAARNHARNLHRTLSARVRL